METFFFTLRSWTYVSHRFTNSSDQGPYHNGHSGLVCRTHSALQVEFDILIYSSIWCLIGISMTLVTNLRRGLDIAGEFKVSSLLAQVSIISQGKCLQSMMGVQVYLYHTFHSWWNDFVGRVSSRILHFFQSLL